jgi:hypothetical protein
MRRGVLASRVFTAFFGLVPGGGVEPPRPEGRRILSPLRLPVPPSRLGIVSDGSGGRAISVSHSCRKLPIAAAQLRIETGSSDRELRLEPSTSGADGRDRPSRQVSFSGDYFRVSAGLPRCGLQLRLRHPRSGASQCALLCSDAFDGAGTPCPGQRRIRGPNRLLLRRSHG